MNAKGAHRRCFAALALLCALSVTPALPATKNVAVVVSAASKLRGIALADLMKLCKGAQRSLPDGQTFTFVIKDPDAPDMRLTMEKLFGMTPAEAKAAIVKLNNSHPGSPVVRIVTTDEEVLNTVAAIPGAIGIVDVYAINSSIKVLRVDGKLPFDLGYVLKGN